MDSFLPNHFLYLLCSLAGLLASHLLTAVDAVSNWWHALVCSMLSLLPKARVRFPVDTPRPGYHPAVLVTGTSSGIGHDTAVALAAHGYTVFAGVRSWEDGARVESDFVSRRGVRDSSGGSSSSGDDEEDTGAGAGASKNMRQRRLRRAIKRRAASRANGLGGSAKATSGDSDCGGSIIPLIIDVASGESVDAAYARVRDEVAARGIPLVGVVNNAGVTAVGPMDTSMPAFIAHCLAVNFHGPVRVTQTFMPLLRASKGRIVNISSIMSWLIGPGFGVYCASKAALSAVSRAWHYELAGAGISVSVLEPGITRTALWHKVETQLEAHYARLNGRRPRHASRSARSRSPPPAALPGDEAVASVSPGLSDDDAAAARVLSAERDMYSPMIRRIKTSNELAPVFALPTHHAVAAILHALQSRYPKSTYRVGWDARLMSLATWIASEEAVEWLCRAIGIVSED
ncbi:hypothetical protein GGI07_001039 [Coemansia sp. Benny D115]|nr:hypothetical protein GGI07_001039 [Coemansia sp. Benny D115]